MSALAGSSPSGAFIVQRLRAAGILAMLCGEGKTFRGTDK
jgi:hypothetical protein